MLRSIPLVILTIALLLAAGCAQQIPASVVPSDGLSASVSKVEDHWNLGLGCYWRVYGTVYNSGGTDVQNVVVYVQLIDTASGNIRDARTIAVGTLAKGGSRSFEVALDGECDRNYRAEVRPVDET
jgi:hypothetical protein